MSVKGKKLATHICGIVDRYQGSSGISRGYFVVLVGALKSVLVFLPAIPPTMVSGIVTMAQTKTMSTIVPNGSAAVLLYAMAMVFKIHSTIVYMTQMLTKLIMI